MRKRWICLALAMMMALSACGGGKNPSHTVPPVSPAPTAPVPTPSPAPTPTPEQPAAVNPLTGEPMEEQWVGRRPVAIMLNNLRQALPQLGQNRADILYEVLAEGGITRMVGVYQCLEGPGRVGSIRSARPYYMELALGHDAIYIHAGGSEAAYAKLNQWGVTHLDGVRGPYLGNSEDSNLMWRDTQRRKQYSLEHTVVTTGDSINKRLPQYPGLRLEHKDGFTYEMTFAEDGTPAGGSPAQTITVPYSNYKTGVFRYDADSGTYLVEEYGKPYMDGESGEQVSVTNVVVIQTACRNTGDQYGHLAVDLSSGGSGYFACGGKIIPLKWSKRFPDGQLKYTDANGDPIVFGVGKTYVNVVPLEKEVRFQ